jgi:hypothetical protein
MDHTYIYTLANFDTDEKWMQSRPLIEFQRKDENIIELMYLSDIHFNFVEKKGTISKMSLYRIKIDKYIDMTIDSVSKYKTLLRECANFYNKRDEILKTNNYSDEFISSLGFQKLVDFNYLVDPDKKEQEFNDYTIKLSYHANKDDFYLDCPHITFPLHL